MSANDVKKQLLDFINKKTFEPILNTRPDKFKGKDREDFEDVRRKTESEKKNFEDYGSADEIKKNYLSNVHSKAAAKVNDQLEKLGLPTMPEHKDEFMELCSKLGV